MAPGRDFSIYSKNFEKPMQCYVFEFFPEILRILPLFSATINCNYYLLLCYDLISCPQQKNSLSLPIHHVVRSLSALLLRIRNNNPNNSTITKKIANLILLFFDFNQIFTTKCFLSPLEPDQGKLGE